MYVSWRMGCVVVYTLIRMSQVPTTAVASMEKKIKG